MHFGHLRAALEARELLGLEDFRLLPAGTPPHREGTMASSQDRLNMVKLAVADYPEFRVDDRVGMTGGPSSTWRTSLSCVAREPGQAGGVSCATGWKIAW